MPCCAGGCWRFCCARCCWWGPSPLLVLVIALPLAWLTVRTDLPLARTWSVLATLPLVIPSYVAAFAVVVALGPRGMLQGFLEPLIGVERLPDISGFPRGHADPHLPQLSLPAADHSGRPATDGPFP